MYPQVSLEFKLFTLYSKLASQWIRTCKKVDKWWFADESLRENALTFKKYRYMFESEHEWKVKTFLNNVLWANKSMTAVSFLLTKDPDTNYLAWLWKYYSVALHCYVRYWTSWYDNYTIWSQSFLGYCI